MRIRTSQVAMVSAGLLGLVVLSGCGSSTPTTTSSANGVTKITFWSSGDTEGVSAIIKAFNTKYHGKYDIKYTQIPYANETEIVNSALSAHRGPDLLEESLTTSAPYAYESVEAPIEPILKMGGINPSTDFPVAMWKGKTVNGVHYVAPVDGLPTLLFYNKAMFKAAGLNPNDPPTTKAEFVHDAEVMTNQTSGTWGYVQEPGWPNPFLFPSLLGQFGGKEANPATRKVLIDSSAGQNALQFEWDAIYKYHISPTNASVNEAHDLFIKGKNAMEMTGAYDYPIYKKALGSNLGVALLPVIGTHPANFLGQNYWWVFKTPSLNSTMEKGLGLFMKFYYDHSMQVAQAGIIPTWEPTLHSAAFKAIPGMALQASALSTGVLNPLIPNWGTTSTEYLYAQIDLALLNKETPKKALSIAESKMQKEMATLIK